MYSMRCSTTTILIHFTAHRTKAGLSMEDCLEVIISIKDGDFSSSVSVAAVRCSCRERKEASTCTASRSEKNLMRSVEALVLVLKTSRSRILRSKQILSLLY